MYLVKINLKGDVTTDQLTNHRDWFSRHFQTGDFVMVGPLLDKTNAGVIIARSMPKEKLTKILSEDAFYPDGATYQVNTFAAKMVQPHITAD